MKYAYKILAQAILGLLICMTNSLSAQAPTLGTYPDVIVISGENAIVTPSSAPIGATNIRAFTSPNFTGLLSIGISTGIVQVVNAKNAGVYTVTVQASSAGGTTFESFTLTVTDPVCSEGLFDGTTALSVGTDPQAIAIGDLNADGNQDIATVNVSSNNATIRFANGIGGFTSVTTNVGASPQGIAIGDFNGDGRHEFASANGGSNTVTIHRLNFLSVYVVHATVTVGNGPVGVAIGDFNGDAKPDILAANYGSNSVSVRFGNGATVFSGTSDIPVGSQPVSIATGDFNGDAILDFATANQGANSVSIRLGNGLGGFTGTDFPVGLFPQSVAFGDFNGDGKQDFAAANANSNTVSIRMGDGLGGFSGSLDLPVPNGPHSVAVGDFNGDAKLDFASANLVANSVSIRLGDGLGNFSGTTDIAVGTQSRSVAFGDFNEDGRHDFATANYGSDDVSIRLGVTSEIDVAGNGNPIFDGALLPSFADHSDFGVVTVGSSLARTYTISNSGTTALTIPVGGITFSGTDAAMFASSGITLPLTLAVGASTSLTVTFTPASNGRKNATLNIANNDCDEKTFDFALAGGEPCDFSTCVGKTLTFTATSSGVSYDWSFGDGGTSTAQNPTHAFASTGTFTVTLQVTDGNGCITTTSQSVCVFDAPTLTEAHIDPACNGASNGAIDLSVSGGAPGSAFTYGWSTGGSTQDLSGLAAGSYTVTVTDPTTTCFQVLTVTLTDPVVLIAATTVGSDVLCFGGNDGTATASATGGTAPYTFAWSNGQSGMNATGLSAGTHTVTVTDANACIATATVSITEPAVLAATTNQINVFCNGGSDGMINLSVTGGMGFYNYLWSNGANTEDLSGLPPGTYTVTVTDDNSCTTTASATITEPSALTVLVSNGGDVCSGTSSSSLSANASGGTPSYSYLWSPGGATSASISNVGAGTHTVTVTDVNGCTVTGNTTIGTFPGTPATFTIGQ